MLDKNTQFINYTDPKTGKKSIISYNEGLKLNIDRAKLDGAMGKMEKIVATRPRLEQLSAEPQAYENPSQQIRMPQQMPMSQAPQTQDYMNPQEQLFQKMAQNNLNLDQLRQKRDRKQERRSQLGDFLGAATGSPEHIGRVLSDAATNPNSIGQTGIHAAQGAGNALSFLGEGMAQPMVEAAHGLFDSPFTQRMVEGQKRRRDYWQHLEHAANAQSPAASLAGAGASTAAVPGLIGVLGHLGKGYKAAAAAGAILGGAGYGSLAERGQNAAIGAVGGPLVHGLFQGAGYAGGKALGAARGIAHGAARAAEYIAPKKWEPAIREFAEKIKPPTELQKDLSPLVGQNRTGEGSVTEQNYDAAKRQKVDLSFAQASQSPTAGAFEGGAAREGMALTKYGNFNEKQAGQMGHAFDRLKDPLPKDVSLKETKEAALGWVNSMKKERSDAAKPFYDKSEKEFTPEVRKWLDEQISANPELKDFIERMYPLVTQEPSIAAALAGKPLTSPEVLHQLNSARLGPILESLPKQGKGYVNSLNKKNYKTIQDLMNEASPSYKKATEIFKEKSAILDELEQLGVVDIAGKKAPNLHKITDFLFTSESLTNPEFAKIWGGLLKQDQKATLGALRRFLEKRTDKVHKTVGSLPNPDFSPDLKNALLKSNIVRERLAIAMPKALKQDFKDLATLADVITRSRKASATKEEALRGMNKSRASTEDFVKLLLKRYEPEEIIDAFTNQNFRVPAYTEPMNLSPLSGSTAGTLPRHREVK